MTVDSSKPEDSAEPPDPQQLSEPSSTIIPAEVEAQAQPFPSKPHPSTESPPIPAESPEITAKPLLIRWLPYILYYILFICIHSIMGVSANMLLALFEESITDKWKIADSMVWERTEVNECLREFASSPGCSPVCGENTQPFNNPASAICISLLAVSPTASSAVPRLRIAYRVRDATLRRSLAEFALQNSNAVMQANGWTLMEPPTFRLVFCLFAIQFLVNIPCMILAGFLSFLIFAVIRFLKNSDQSFATLFSRLWPPPHLLCRYLLWALLGCALGTAVGMLINFNFAAISTLYSMNEGFRLRYSPNSVAEPYCGAFQPVCGLLWFQWSVNVVQR